VAATVPLDRLLIETDSPYLTPHPFRGKRNEPSYVKYVAEKIAEMKEIGAEEVAERTSDNARNLFRW
jgi:TatD DNase family protein